MHHAAVRLPPPEPSDRHRIVGPRTVTWPCGPIPVGSPKSRTRASRASSALALGQGWRALQDPSISRAAIPASRILGPSSHQIGPSPSHTATGVQAKVSPAGTAARRKSENTIGQSRLHHAVAQTGTFPGARLAFNPLKVMADHYLGRDPGQRASAMQAWSRNRMPMSTSISEFLQPDKFCRWDFP